MNHIVKISKALASIGAFVSHNGVVNYAKDFEEKGYAKLMLQIGRDFYHITIQKGHYVGD